MKSLALFFVVVVLMATPICGSEPFKDNIAKLISPVAAERRAGEAWLAEEGTEAVAELIEHVETGDTKRKVEAIEKLLLLISPWQRGIERGNRHHGQIELFWPMRPTGRPVDHPQAVRLRKVLLATLGEALRDIEREPPADGDFTRLISAASVAIAEVADDRVANAIRDLLAKETDPTLGVRLMRCLETIDGLPSFYEMHGICGLGLTPEVLRKYRQREAEAFAVQKRALLDWLDNHAQKPKAERIDAAIALWAERSAANPMYYVSRGNGSPILGLARLGSAGVPGLRKQQARESTLIGRGFYEVVIATITGEVNDALVRELIDVKNLPDRNHHQIACEIIALANSQAYRKELVAMLGDSRYWSHAVAHTLAIVHRHDAIPLLREQPQENYTAHCAVKELESWAK